MRVTLNEDKNIVEEVREKLRENDYYCPCKLDHIPENKCMCKAFIEETAVGSYCHCGLYKKLS